MLLPIAGDAKGFVEVFTGEDLITGEQLGPERYLGLIFLSELRLLRHGDEVAGFAGKYADDALDALGDYCSFSYDTLVLTRKGLRPIGTLAIDDEVWAYDEASGEMGWYPVTAVWAEEHRIVVHLTIAGELIETTREHPFKTAEGAWVAAGRLQVGDRIYRADGTVGTVEAIGFLSAPQVMYNLTVAEAHTYFVGVGRWLVHNDCGDPVRQQISNLFGPQQCADCARAMNEYDQDEIFVVTNREAGMRLKGAQGEDIGAPFGWHVFTKDNRGYAWDNFGCHGLACDYEDALRKQNPGVQIHDPYNNIRETDNVIDNFMRRYDEIERNFGKW